MAQANYLPSTNQIEPDFSSIIESPGDKSLEDHLVDILLGKDVKESMNIYEKFADISPFNVLEENLMISNDGHEVAFRVIYEQESPTTMQYLTIDLSSKELKFWNKNFGDLAMNSPNPYTMKNVKKNNPDLKKLAPCIVVKSIPINNK